MPTLEGDTEVTVPANVTVYSDTLSGTYTVRVCADSGKAVDESLESNNCGDAPGTVTVQGITQSNADLVVISVPDPPAHALPGDPLTLTASGQEPGQRGRGGFVDHVLPREHELPVKKNVKNPSTSAGLPTAALPAGQSITPPTAAFSVYGDTLAGTYFLQACADGPKAIAEAIEGNNCTNSVGTITIDQAPNLVVTSIGNPWRRRRWARGSRSRMA